MKGIPKGYIANFETMKNAAANGDLALVQVRERATGNTRVAVCAVGYDGAEYLITPFALMFDGDPYALLDPPNPKGGF